MQAPFTLSSKTLTVGGRVVVITRCAATEALDLELSLAKVIGGGIGLLLESGDIMDGAAAAIGGVAKQLTQTELLRLMKLVFQYTTVEGQQIGDINSTFADRPRDVWEVFVEAVKFNLGPLGDWLREKSPKLKKTQGSQGSSP